jgi:predicted Zn-dependent peptidase
MYFGRFFGIDEMMEEIEAVTTADVQELAQELFQPETMALTLLGNLGSMKIERGDLAC